MDLQVTPISGINSPMPIVVSGLAPGANLELKVKAVDAANRLFSSTTVFKANSDGVVDTSKHLPQDAGWVTPSSLGVLWKMMAQDGKDATFAVDGLNPMRVEVQARVEGEKGKGTHVTRTISRRVREITPLPVSCKGRAFCPDEPGPFPLVVLFGGAGGGVDSASAAVLAHHGVAVFSYDYFPRKKGGVVDVDAVRRMLRGIRLLPEIDSSLPVALCGTGRGAELALLIASLEPNLVGAVVAHSPTDVLSAWPDKDSQPDVFVGSGLPKVTIKAPGKQDVAADWHAFIQPKLKGQPWRLRAYYDSAREHTKDIEAAAIEVEKMSGPLLLTAGSEDAVWDSASMSLTLQLRASDVEVFRYVAKGAGHNVGYPFYFPGLPAQKTMNAYGYRIALGGHSVTNGQASVDSRVQVISFLRSAFGLED